ncbi:methyltransferase domain-containing protein [Micromonospora sp. NPDC050397]|uniref:methyltransferase domain-containing protein n=1 Tax=Micromonospora sp. NPDC050397 TaxID=3364279 RepID=UPI00384B2D13
MTDEIAGTTSFSDVDGAGNELQTSMVDYLERIAAYPSIRQVREVARAALDAWPGQRLLDAGAGAGEVARELARLVGPEGEVVAVDRSEFFVTAATRRHDGSRVEYLVGDVTALDLADESFDGVRSERVMQHLAEPDRAVAELVRVLRPGGRLCLIDTDWESLLLDGIAPELIERIRGKFFQYVATPEQPDKFRMGRTLRRRLLAAGLDEVRAEPITVAVTDFAEANAIAPIFDRDAIRRLGADPALLGAEWFEAVDASVARGDFLLAITIWVVSGVKPLG